MRSHRLQTRFRCGYKVCKAAFDATGCFHQAWTSAEGAGWWRGYDEDGEWEYRCPKHRTK